MPRLSDRFFWMAAMLVSARPTCWPMVAGDVGSRRLCDDHRCLYLLDLAGSVVGLLLQIAHLARQRVEPLLLAGAGGDGGCGRGDHGGGDVSCVVVVVVVGLRPGIRVAQQSNHCDAGNQVNPGNAPGRSPSVHYLLPPRCAAFSRGFLRPHVAGYGDEPAGLVTRFIPV